MGPNSLTNLTGITGSKLKLPAAELHGLRSLSVFKMVYRTKEAMEGHFQ